MTTTSGSSESERPIHIGIGPLDESLLRTFGVLATEEGTRLFRTRTLLGRVNYLYGFPQAYMWQVLRDLANPFRVWSPLFLIEGMPGKHEHYIYETEVSITKAGGCTRSARSWRIRGLSS